MAPGKLVTVLLEPLARSTVQGRYLLRLLGGQMHAKHIRKEMVIAIPVTLIVQRNEKEVAPLQGLQSGAAILLVRAHNSIT